MSSPLENNVLKIDLKLQLKRKVNGCEFIHYVNLTEDLDNELFNDIKNAIRKSMDKQFNSIIIK